MSLTTANVGSEFFLKYFKFAGEISSTAGGFNRQIALFNVLDLFWQRVTPYNVTKNHVQSDLRMVVKSNFRFK